MSPIVVIGAGIIGTTIAYDLQCRGETVVLIDKNTPGTGASFGNMASIAVTEFLPASRPGIWRQLPKWLLDPQGPIHIRPSHIPALISWFVRFLAAGRPARLRALEAAGAALCGRVHEDLRTLLRHARLEHMLSQTGCLSLYANAAEFRADRAHIDALERFGFPHKQLHRKALRDLEPALSNQFESAVLFPDNRSITDPYQLVLALADQFQALGGRIEQGEVGDFVCADGRVSTVKLKDGRQRAASRVVLAAGAYTGRLSALLGEPIPLETERGYHTQLATPGIALRHALIWPARAFMMTPTAGGIRVGGTVEMAGLDAAPDYRRARTLIRHAQAALPGLNVEQNTEWMGHRPALPDTVPILSRSAQWHNVFYATGHGHLGLTYAATTGRLMADLITDTPPPIDMTPYRVNRF